MHSETTSQQHSTALRSTSVPSEGPQAETALLPPVSVQPATAVGALPLPSVFLLVDFPNGGETFNARDMVTVRWSTSVQDGTPVASHAVRLFVDGNLVTEVTDLPGTTQSYQLTLPDINTTRAVVSVSAINGIRVLAGDRSDNVFTIQGASTGPVIMGIDPPAIRAGATTRVTVRSVNEDTLYQPFSTSWSPARSRQGHIGSWRGQHLRHSTSWPARRQISPPSNPVRFRQVLPLSSSCAASTCRSAPSPISW